MASPVLAACGRHSGILILFSMFHVFVIEWMLKFGKSFRSPVDRISSQSLKK